MNREQVCHQQMGQDFIDKQEWGACKELPGKLSRILQRLVMMSTLFLAYGVYFPPLASAQLLTDFEPPAQKHLPVKKQTEAGNDQVAADAFYMQGNMLTKQRKWNEALDAYQKAYFFSSQKGPICSEIVKLSYLLKRKPLAVRYALLDLDALNLPSIVQRQLAIDLAAQKKYNEVIKVYKSLAKKKKPNLKDASYLLIQLELGRMHFLKKEYDQAVAYLDVFHQAVEKLTVQDKKKPLMKVIVSKPRAINVLLAETYLQTKRYKQALGIFEKVLTGNQAIKNPKKVAEKMLFFQAKVLFVQQKYGEAQQALEKYLATDQTKFLPGTFVLLRDALLKKHDRQKEKYEIAQKRLKTLSKQYPQDIAIASTYAELFVRQKKYPQAIKLYQKLNQLYRQKNRGRVSFKLQVLLAKLYLEHQDYQGFLTTFSKMVPSLEDVKFKKLFPKFFSKQEVVDALLAKVKELDRQEETELTPDQRFTVALLLLEQKQIKLANRYFVKSANKLLGNQRLAREFTWALQLFQLDQNKQAETLLRRVLQRTTSLPMQRRIQLILAVILSVEKKHDQALAMIEKRLAGSKDDILALQRKAWILMRAKKYQAARKIYVKLYEQLSSRHHNEQVRKLVYDIRHMLSVVDIELENPQQAETWLLLNLQEYPQDIGMFNDLGYLWADRAVRLNRAKQMLKRAIEAEPKNASYQDSYGWVLYRLGDFEGALKHLKISQKYSKSPNGEILEHLGDVQHRLKQQKQAIDSWTKSIQYYKQDQQPKRAKRVESKLEKYQQN